VSYDRGFGGLVAGDTTIARIDGGSGRLFYRGYPIEALAASASFEEVSFLLLRGELPSPRALEAWREELARWRGVPDALVRSLDARTEGSAFARFRTAMAAVVASSPHRGLPANAEPIAQTARILSWSTALAAAATRRARGLSVIPARDDLSHAAHFLWLLSGKDASVDAVRALEVSLVVQAEHGLHAAALAALTVASAGGSMDEAIFAGIGALGGALHGGANVAAFEMVAARSGPDDARAWVRARIAERYRFPGFGHRVYKTHDPRARALEAHARRLLEASKEKVLWHTFEALRDEVERALGSKGLYANIDALTGLVYHPLGLPRDAFTLPFCLAIQTGWMAHCLEYLPDGPPIRPSAPLSP